MLYQAKANDTDRPKAHHTHAYCVWQDENLVCPTLQLGLHPLWKKRKS